MPKAATLKIQQWGNSLAVRIPAGVARSARFAVGMEVELAVQEVGVIVTPLGPRKLTLAEKLARFDAEVVMGKPITRLVRWLNS